MENPIAEDRGHRLVSAVSWSSPIALSPSIAAARSPSPCALSSHPMPSVAVLISPSCPICLWVPIHRNHLPVKVWGTNKHLSRQIFWSRSANEVSFAQTSLSLTVQQPWRADAKYFLKPLQLSELLHLESKDRTVSLPLCLVYTDSNLFEKRTMGP